MCMSYPQSSVFSRVPYYWLKLDTHKMNTNILEEKKTARQETLVPLVAYLMFFNLNMCGIIQPVSLHFRDSFSCLLSYAHGVLGILTFYFSCPFNTKTVLVSYFILCSNQHGKFLAKLLSDSAQNKHSHYLFHLLMWTNILRECWEIKNTSIFSWHSLESFVDIKRSSKERERL